MIDEKRLIEELRFQINNCEKYGHSDIYVDLEMAKQWLRTFDKPKVGEWIPFNKKEPKEEGLYLCCFDDGFITTVEYEDGDWILWADSGEVVAWQPLPESYEVKDND